MCATMCLRALMRHWLAFGTFRHMRTAVETDHASTHTALISIRSPLFLERQTLWIKTLLFSLFTCWKSVIQLKLNVLVFSKSAMAGCSTGVMGNIGAFCLN